jgi:competence protein ComFA
MEEVQAFLTGRIWLKEQTPFPLVVIEEFIQKGYITPTQAFSLIKIPIVKTKSSTCRRCGNQQLTVFQCAKM